MNNHTNKKREFDSKIEQQVAELGERIRLAIAPTSQRAFAKVWKGSFTTINHYINGKSTPSIHDLINIAKLTNTDALWLLTGQHYAQSHPHCLDAEQHIEICPDNTMAPTINVGAPVVLETIRTEWPVPDGVYCVKNAQGNVFRRLQWDEEKQGFWLRCDNPHFEPQFAEHPSLIGKAVGAVTCVL